MHSYLVHICDSKHSLMMNLSSETCRYKQSLYFNMIVVLTELYVN